MSDAQLLTILLLLVFVLAAVGLLMLCLRLRFYLTGEWAEGEFVDWDRSRGYFVRARYTVRGGKTYETARGLGYRLPRKPKPTYPILYSSTNPQNGIVYHTLQFWSVPVGFVILPIGLIPVLLSVIGGWDSFLYHLQILIG